jgi:hypothetical protein
MLWPWDYDGCPSPVKPMLTVVPLVRLLTSTAWGLSSNYRI